MVVCGGDASCPGSQIVFLLLFLGADLLLLHGGYASGALVGLPWYGFVPSSFPSQLSCFPTPFPCRACTRFSAINLPVVPGWSSARFSDFRLMAMVRSVLDGDPIPLFITLDGDLKFWMFLSYTTFPL